MTMKHVNRTFRPLLGIVSCLLCFAVSGAEPPAPSSLATFDDLTARWVALRTTLAREKQDWRRAREHLRTEIELLERREHALDRALDRVGEEAEAVADQQAPLVEKKQAMDQIEARIRSRIEQAEADLKRWSPVVPALVQETFTSTFDALPADVAESSRSLAERAQAVVAVYGEIEAAQNAIHAGRQRVQTGEGTRRHVDVLYLGLAVGYAVSPADDWAAVGHPVEGGWRWREATKYAHSIRAAIDVFEQNAPARAVPLPVELSAEDTR